MATVVDTLVTRYTLDPSGYAQGAKQVVSSSGQMKAAHGSAMKEMGRDIESFLGPIRQGASVFAGFATAVLGMGAALIGLGVMASKSAGDFDALIQALAAVEGGMEGAKKRYKELYGLAQAPGIGPDEAVKGFTLLKRSGLGAEFAKSLMREFANQNAMAGGGKAEFGRLMQAAMQIASKPHLQGDELLQLTEAGLPVHPMLKKAFGTSDTEELKKRGLSGVDVLKALTLEMAKTARVGDSAKNAWENLGSEVEAAVRNIGAGLNTYLMPLVNSLKTSLTELNQSGAFKTFAEEFASIIGQFAKEMGLKGGLTDTIIELGAIVLDVTDSIRNFIVHWKALGDGFNKFFPAPKLPGAMGGMSRGTKWAEGMRHSIEFNAAMAKENPQAGEADKPVADKIADGNSILQQIAENTQPLLDMKRSMLGGGPLGRNAISPVELGGMRSPNRHVAQIVAGVIGLMQPSMIDALKSRS